MHNNIHDITIDNIKSFGKKDDLKQGSDDYNDAVACIKVYQKQATALSDLSRSNLVKKIIRGRFFRPEEKRDIPSSHVLYQEIRDRGFALKDLSWSSYIILRTLYNELPVIYEHRIKEKFKTLEIIDRSHEFFAIHPSAKDRYTVTEDVSEESEAPQASTLDDGERPAPKRQKTQDVRQRSTRNARSQKAKKTSKVESSKPKNLFEFDSGQASVWQMKERLRDILQQMDSNINDTMQGMNKMASGMNNMASGMNNMTIDMNSIKDKINSQAEEIASIKEDMRQILPLKEEVNLLRQELQKGLQENNETQKQLVSDLNKILVGFAKALQQRVTDASGDQE